MLQKYCFDSFLSFVTSWLSFFQVWLFGHLMLILQYHYAFQYHKFKSKIIINYLHILHPSLNYISMCNRHAAHKPTLGFSLPLLLMLYCFNHWNLWVTPGTAGLMLVALWVVSFHQPMGQPWLAAVFWCWSFGFNVSLHSLTNLKNTWHAWGETVILLCNIRN